MNKLIEDTQEMEAFRIRSGKMIDTVKEISHDFKNILTAIKGLTEMLTIVAKDPRRVAEVAELLHKATDRGTELTQEILQTKSPKKPQATFTNVVAQVNETVEMIKGSIPARIRLNLNLDPEIPLVNVDSGHLHRILSNLILNASDAIPGEGAITVNAECVEVHDFSEELPGLFLCSFLRLQVIDTGVGMDEYVRQRAVQAHFTTKTAGKGNGLGLSIVSSLMQEYMGSVDIVSTVGKGTKVELLFPISSTTDKQLDAIPSWRQNL